MRVFVYLVVNIEIAKGSESAFWQHICFDLWERVTGELATLGCVTGELVKLERVTGELVTLERVSDALATPRWR